MDNHQPTRLPAARNEPLRRDGSLVKIRARSVGAWTAYGDYTTRAWLFRGAGKKSEWEIWEVSADRISRARKWFWWAVATLCVFLIVVGTMADIFGTPLILEARGLLVAFRFSSVVSGLVVIGGAVVVYSASAIECEVLRQRRRVIRAEAEVMDLDEEQIEARTAALTEQITTGLRYAERPDWWRESC